MRVALAGRAGAAGLEDLLTRHGVAPGALDLAVRTVVHATTLICNAVEALLDAPGQWAALCADPAGLAGAAVEETLTWHPPVRLESRIAQEDVEVAGARIPADGHVVVLVAAAHRDLAAAAGRTGFDVTAGTTTPSLFPITPLVRTVARSALRVLAEEAPGLRRTGPAVRLRRAPVTLRHARFPVAPQYGETTAAATVTTAHSA